MAVWEGSSEFSPNTCLFVCWFVFLVSRIHPSQYSSMRAACIWFLLRDIVNVTVNGCLPIGRDVPCD